LELYALHKQAISGDAPASFSSEATVAEKARYQAWKGKKGLTPNQAMSAYVAECDRQIRVYSGSTGINSATQTPMTTPNPALTEADTAPRGIAAIPLLCAAAAESRVAYLRRLSRTQVGWWSRQEPLCGTPGTITSLPEALLLAVASLVEYLSLQGVQHVPLPPSVLQSFLWPLHNISLAAWMLLILVFTAIASAFSIATTILWGSRRTGMTLQKVWQDEIVPASTGVHNLCQSHQPISVRLMGLIMLPYTVVVEGICQGFVEPIAGPLINSLAYTGIMLCLTWWYWMLLVPMITCGLFSAALWSGVCFALIDFAGV